MPRLPWPPFEIPNPSGGHALKVAVLKETRSGESRVALVPMGVKALVKAGLDLAVASSSDLRLIDGALQRLGVLDRFPVRRSAFDEENGKPHPAVYLRVADILDVDPARCVAFEDSPAGVESACRAGMRVIAVPAEEHRGHPGIEAADLVLPSLEDLRPEHLG